MATTDAASAAGKTVLVTGATDGIGRETARELARRGATVLAHARTRERGEPVVADLRAAAPRGRVELVVGDLASLASVRGLAADVLARFERLDVLINNAGLVTSRRQVSADGYELTFAVNHLAHFLLTNLLVDRLKASAPARVITVSSNVHRGATIHWDDLQLERGWSGYAAYGQSKLANVLFTYELARRLKGAGVTANALHPGVINTKLLREGFGSTGASVAAGARTSVYLATDAGVADVTGQYFQDGRPVQSAPMTYDEGAQRRLWEISEELTGLRRT